MWYITISLYHGSEGVIYMDTTNLFCHHHGHKMLCLYVLFHELLISQLISVDLCNAQTDLLINIITYVTTRLLDH